MNSRLVCPVIIFLLIGCTPSPTPILEDKPETKLIPSSIPAPEYQQLVGNAKDDMAKRLGISADDITVVSVISQEFSTNAFYCQVTKERIAKEESPQVVLGQSILLKALGRQYEYHASDKTVIFCRSLP